MSLNSAAHPPSTTSAAKAGSSCAASTLASRTRAARCSRIFLIRRAASHDPKIENRIRATITKMITRPNAAPPPPPA